VALPVSQSQETLSLSAQETESAWRGKSVCIIVSGTIAFAESFALASLARVLPNVHCGGIILPGSCTLLSGAALALSGPLLVCGIALRRENFWRDLGQTPIEILEGAIVGAAAGAVLLREAPTLTQILVVEFATLISVFVSKNILKTPLA
jgi:hypothetical protein